METVSQFERRYHGCRRVSIITDAETGETFCSACGLVLPEIPQVAPQLIQPDGGQPNHRITGSYSSLRRSDMGLCTIIGKVDRDASGKSIGQPMMSTIYRMRKLDRTIIGNPEANSNFGIAFPKLDKYKDILAVSDVVAEMAAHIYRKAWKSGVVKGKRQTPYVAAALYIACKRTSTLRTMKEVAQAANISLKKFQKSHNRLVMEMDMKVPQTDTIRCVTRVASSANITERTKRCAIGVLSETIGHDDLVGRRPISLAATALYLSCIRNGEDKTLQDIAKAANCSIPTIVKIAEILDVLTKRPN